MVHELHLDLHVVVPDDVPVSVITSAVVGRELPGVPGTWIATAAVRGPDARDDELGWDVRAAEADAEAGLGGD